MIHGGDLGSIRRVRLVTTAREVLEMEKGLICHEFIPGRRPRGLLDQLAHYYAFAWDMTRPLAGRPGNSATSTVEIGVAELVREL